MLAKSTVCRCQICRQPVRTFSGQMIHIFCQAGEKHRRWPGGHVPTEFSAALARLQASGLKAFELNTTRNVVHGCAKRNGAVEQHVYFERSADGKWVVRSALPDFSASVDNKVGPILKSQFDGTLGMPELLQYHAEYQKVPLRNHFARRLPSFE
eukprot:TRINITY_DN22159_c0_g1_i1.p1 TRINITY_DN22159_c0_g1~~TRINITY_DN22159_c0_g1_i1.p1  ORF type:complete len:154 (+),score=11.23 TRINITY_DN22159_c0_g1_i1:1-462(+)